MASSAIKTETKGHCPACGPDRHAQVVASHAVEWDEHSVWGRVTYNVLRCGGCGEVYFQKVSENSEDTDYAYDERGETVELPKPKYTYWPSPVRRPAPDWLYSLKDDVLRNVLEEGYEALDADHRILAAIGARTALDRAMVLLGTTAGSFAGKLEELVSRKMIGNHEKEILGVLTDAGSASAHRGWRPTSEHLSTIMDGTENFLHRTFILGKAARAMRRQVPARKRARAKPP